VAGVWHRLDISCSSSGTVTVTLDGSSVNTWTTTVNKMSVSGTSAATAAAIAGNARITITPGAATTPAAAANFGYFPFVTGTQITVSGYTGGAAILNNGGNPTPVLGVGNGENLFYGIASTTTLGNGNAAGTVTGCPGFLPCCVYGNDDTASPEGDDMRLYVDFFALTWNPALAAGGTPNATKARYW
jgi:hypothetical protein